MKPFQSQIRLHKFNVDEAQRRLAELLRLEERLREDLVRLEQELAAEQKAAESLEASVTYAAFAERVIERRNKLNHSIAEVAEQIVQARDGLRDAFAELKKFELAAEAAEERLKKRREQREQAQQDDVALNIFRRKPE
ncbi:MAG TPA: flagellar FliJ family protein [Aliidongia sp.]|nr:flagellar FliJ family protein [Aliidongia sp.]